MYIISTLGLRGSLSCRTPTNNTANPTLETTGLESLSWRADICIKWRLSQEAVILEKLTVAHLVKEFPALMEGSHEHTTGRFPVRILIIVLILSTSLPVLQMVPFLQALNVVGQVVNTPSYSRGPEFKPRPGDRLCWLKFSWFSSDPQANTGIVH
jgi:hypothetical protein